jgi:hydroxymethylbilane synthase
MTVKTTSSRPIRIGTRGSKLALWQAEYVAGVLQAGGLNTEIVLIDTKGDQILDRALSKIGSKGVFTEELEAQLRSGDIDIAQHSAKDLQSELADDLEIIAFTSREQVNDVLVSLDRGVSLESGQPLVVGTSSTRRVAMLRRFYPHIQTVDMRGNLVTRLQKLRNGHCQALLLAYAGVHRMGYAEHIVAQLDPTHFVPAVGQGSVAIEASRNLDSSIRGQIRTLLNDATTERCILAERAFLRRLQGGCSIPVYGLATQQTGQLSLRGGIISLDGQHLAEVQQQHTEPGAEPEALGLAVAEAILSKGGAGILAGIRSAMHS